MEAEEQSARIEEHEESVEKEQSERMLEGEVGSGFDAEEEEYEHGDRDVREKEQPQPERGETGVEAEGEEDEQGNLGFRRPGEEKQDEQEGGEADMEAEDEAADKRVLHLSFPPGRVKRIMKLDREISKVHSEALFLVSLSTELFLEFLASKAGAVALANKKKSVRLDHLLSAARNHPPSADFLLDSLSLPAKTFPPPEPKQAASIAKPLPPGARRIDEFFRKPSSVAPE